MEYSERELCYVDLIKGHAPKLSGNGQTDKKKQRVINTSISLSLYRRIEEESVKRQVGPSRVIIDAVNEFLSNTKDCSDSIISFKKIQQLYSLKISNSRRVGLGLNEEEHYMLKSFSERNNTSMSEVVRAILENKFSEDDTSEYVSETSKGNTGENVCNNKEFVMYIDLA